MINRSTRQGSRDRNTHTMTQLIGVVMDFPCGVTNVARFYTELCRLRLGMCQQVVYDYSLDYQKYTTNADETRMMENFEKAAK